MNLSLRLATRISDFVAQRVATTHVLGLPSRLHSCLQSCMILHSKIRKAQDKGFAVAEKIVHKQLIVTMDRLKRQAETISLSPPEPDKAPGVLDIYADIKALEEEFGGYKWDHERETLSVTTDPVTLLDVPLGPFRIDLKLSHFKIPTNADSGTHVDALDPNVSGEHFHPHVGAHGAVCLGDGAPSIRRALEDGRVLDYFIILKQLLNSYDRDGAYTILENWGEEDEDRIDCSDCGYATLMDESMYCDCCSDSYCDECYGSCESCEEVVCDGCRRTCVTCTSSVCAGCIQANCKDCGAPLCETCSTNNEGCGGCSGMLCERCVQSCSSCSTQYCKSCASEEIGDCKCDKPGQCSDCREKCDFCEVRQPGESYLGPPKEHPEFEKAETQVFGAPAPGFLPEPAVQENEENCEPTTA